MFSHTYLFEKQTQSPPSMDRFQASHVVSLKGESKQTVKPTTESNEPNGSQDINVAPEELQNSRLKGGTSKNTRTLANNTSEARVIRRTRVRYKLRDRARVLNDVLVALAMGGLLLAIAVNQLIFSEAFGKSGSEEQINHPALVAMRCVISATTVAELVVDLLYSWTVLRIRLVDLAEKPPLVVIRTIEVALSVLELLVCAVHPLPWDFRVMQTAISATPPIYYQSPINVNLFLTIFMFLRLHLVVRAVLMHHPLYRSPAAHMFGPLHRVSVGYGFLFRVLMDSYAGSVMLVCIVTTWLCFAWIFMQCESVSSTYTRDYMSAFWFIVVTFTTV